jgi:hypothetical protein
MNNCVKRLLFGVDRFELNDYFLARRVSKFTKWPYFYLPHLKYEGSIGFETKKKKIFFAGIRSLLGHLMHLILRILKFDILKIPYEFRLNDRRTVQKCDCASQEKQER